jgi:triacylglycerol lipase
MGCYHGTTKAGCVVDNSWYANDGLVNTLSARAPFGSPQKPLDRSNIERGVWNVMPDLQKDHGFFQGGFIKKQNPHAFFDELLELLQSLG